MSAAGPAVAAADVVPGVSVFATAPAPGDGERGAAGSNAAAVATGGEAAAAKAPEQAAAPPPSPAGPRALSGRPGDIDNRALLKTASSARGALSPRGAGCPRSAAPG